MNVDCRQQQAWQIGHTSPPGLSNSNRETKDEFSWRHARRIASESHNSLAYNRLIHLACLLPTNRLSCAFAWANATIEIHPTGAIVVIVRVTEYLDSVEFAAKLRFPACLQKNSDFPIHRGGGKMPSYSRFSRIEFRTAWQGICTLVDGSGSFGRSLRQSRSRH